MENFGNIEAVRLSLEQEMDTSDKLPTGKLRVKNSQNSWFAAIIRVSYQLSKFSKSIVLKASNIYYNQIRAENESDFRMTDPARPVQISQGILEAIELIAKVESILGGAEERIELYNRMAVFAGYDVYEDIAKVGLNFIRTITPRTRLFAHTYLWIMWIHEALQQANQFGGLLESDYNLERLSAGAFPYIAHPPLIVATVACTTMIEEVGVEYINAYVEDQDYNRNQDHTSARLVLEDLESSFPNIEQVNTQAIKDHVIEARDNISHYVTKRKNAVHIDDFEEFYNAVVEGVELVDAVLTKLIDQPTSQFQDELETFENYSWY